MNRFYQSFHILALAGALFALPTWSANNAQTGWVAARYLAEDGDLIPNPADAANRATPAPTPTATDAAPAQVPDRCSAPTPTAGTAATSPALLETVQSDEYAFVQAPGFAPDLVLETHLADYYDLARFPHAEASALRPDHALASVARALLLFDHAEGVIAHPRYRITYHLKSYFDDCDLLWRAYIEVTRFNLGQARYEEVTRYVEPDYWPPVALFEPGPHVSRRFAVGPVQSLRADIKQSSRRVMDAAAAAQADCLGVPCLALQDASGPTGPWTDALAPASASDIYNEPAYDWAPGPARVAELLYVQAAGGPDDIEASEATSLAHPDITLVISRDVVGQDGNTQGLLQWQGLMDDAIAEQWLRLQAAPELPPQVQEHMIYRRGGS